MAGERVAVVSYDNQTKATAGRLALLGPSPPARSPTRELVDRLSGEIVNGRIAPGARLPTEQGMMAYLERIQVEHRRIYDAVRAGDSAVARQAMRRHLMGSRRRYQRFAVAGGAL